MTAAALRARTAHDKMNHHQAEVQRWAKVRAKAVAAMRAEGMTLAAIGDTLGITRSRVLRLLESPA